MPKVRAFEIAPLPLDVTASLEALGRRIALARKERGHSIREFADMLGVSTQTLVSIEHGAPTVQVGYYARAIWMLEIRDAVLGEFSTPSLDADNWTGVR
jgi:transcriptional regulator with XRE-family HTH domain